MIILFFTCTGVCPSSRMYLCPLIFKYLSNTSSNMVNYRKTSQIDHKLNILSFHLREDEHPVPPPPDLWQHVVQQLELSCWGKAVILKVPLNLPSSYDRYGLQWLVNASPWNLSHIEGGCQGPCVRYIDRSRKSCGCRSRTLSAGPRRQKSFEDAWDPGYTIIKHLKLLLPR